MDNIQRRALYFHKYDHHWSHEWHCILRASECSQRCWNQQCGGVSQHCNAEDHAERAKYLGNYCRRSVVVGGVYCWRYRWIIDYELSVFDQWRFIVVVCIGNNESNCHFVTHERNAVSSCVACGERSWKRKHIEHSREYTANGS